MLIWNKHTNMKHLVSLHLSCLCEQWEKLTCLKVIASHSLDSRFPTFDLVTRTSRPTVDFMYVACKYANTSFLVVYCLHHVLKISQLFVFSLCPEIIMTIVFFYRMLYSRHLQSLCAIFSIRVCFIVCTVRTLCGFLSVKLWTTLTVRK